MTEFVWTFNGYRVCKRKRAAVDSDRSGKHRVWSFTDAVYETELEAVQAAFDAASSLRDKLERDTNNAQKVVHKWFLRRKKLKTLLAESARDMRADMLGENGNG